MTVMICVLYHFWGQAEVNNFVVKYGLVTSHEVYEEECAFIETTLQELWIHV